MTSTSGTSAIQWSRVSESIECELSPRIRHAWNQRRSDDNGTTGLTVGQRVFGLTDWYRDGTLAEYAAVEATNPAGSMVTQLARGAGAYVIGRIVVV